MPLLVAVFRAAASRIRERGRHDGDVGDGDHVTARVATWNDDLTLSVRLLRAMKGLQLFDPAPFQRGDPPEHCSGLSVDRDARLMELAWECPEPRIRRVDALAQQDAQLSAEQREDRQVN
jgi:hypothetical protein